MVITQQRTLLIVEDDPGLQSQLRWAFDDYEVVVADSRDAALAQLRRYEPQVVTLDLGLPPAPDETTEGFATLTAILELAPNTKVIIATGNDQRDNAVKAIGLGAYDFVAKPIDADLLSLIVDRAFQLFDLQRENRELGKTNPQSPLDGIIAASDSMMKSCRTIEKVAPTNATVLLLGESGTGKELFARAVHDLSLRKEAPFIAINCAAIPDNLLESELFGYEKGAFTGAAKQTRGKVEYADGGTLFLDEVGDLPQALQSKLLRFLQERVVERIGGRTEIPVDIRVVCATHQNLEALIKTGGFRQDLYYRISEISVLIPPLRERADDALLIARHLLDRFAAQNGGNFRGFSDDAVRAISQHAWPGNVRELENRVKRASIMAEGSYVNTEDLDFEISDDEPHLALNLKQARETAERKAVTQAINITNGNLSQAAELLGITRPTLYSILDKFGLRPS